VKLLGKASAKKPLEKASSKAQSAMEYLMTYGWAILIIAVVLGALFQLGVFNPMTFAPKAPPGACQVFRPNGPGTTSFINLEGICTGEIPQYVAQFNGQSSEIVESSPAITIGTNYGISFWIYPASFSGYPESIEQRGGVIQDGPPYSTTGQIRVGMWIGGVYEVYSTTTSIEAPLNSWSNIAVTLNGNVLTECVNAVCDTVTVASGTIATTNNPIHIGSWRGISNWLNGRLSNIQLYNTSLSANEIQALYQEGIGGAPIDLQHLVAWWPLNGNANDYSGNGNNGVPANVTFASSWYSGYTPP